MTIDGANNETTAEPQATETSTANLPSKPPRSNGATAAQDFDLNGSDAELDKRKRRKAAAIGEVVFCRPLEVSVRDDRVDQAIRQLKNRMAREGVLRELKNRRHYFKPSELKRIKRREAARRRRKQIRQKASR